MNRYISNCLKLFSNYHYYGATIMPTVEQPLIFNSVIITLLTPKEVTDLCEILRKSDPAMGTTARILRNELLDYLSKYDEAQS